MLHKTAEIIVYKLFEKDDSNIANYIYGMELFLSSFICSILLLLIGTITDTFFESIIFILFFSALRIYTGGFHAHSFMLCTVITLVNYIVIICIYRWLYNYFSRLYVNLPVFILTLFVIVIVAPVDNPNNPLDKNQCVVYKKRAIITLFVEIIIFYTLLFVLSYNECVIIIPTLMSVDIFMIVPIFSKFERRNV